MKQINNIIRTLNLSKKKKCFFFGNTIKKESTNYYITEVRESNRFIYIVGIFYNNNSAKKIAKAIDGKVDLILVDTEKKVISKNKKNLVNIETSVKENIKISKVFTYKGNDLTVQAAETFLTNYFLFFKDNRGLGGKKILILGSGNIGTKLGLKLVENGAEVSLYRRNKKKLNYIVKTINSIVPLGTASKSNKFNFKDDLSNFDIIIGCTSGKALISKKIVNKISKKTIILDIGKGIFTKSGLNESINRNLSIFRLDISPAYNAYLENVYSTRKLGRYINAKYKNFNNFNLIQRGVLGKKGCIIVDNTERPKKIFGITDGFAGMKKLNQKKLRELKKKIIFKR